MIEISLIFVLYHISYNQNAKVSSLQKHDYSPTCSQNLTEKLHAFKMFGQFIALRTLARTARVSSSSELARSASYD